MFQFQLTSPQRELLAEILQSALSDLSMEIADTDRSVFKDQLRQRKQVLSDILAEVSSAMAKA